MLKPLSVFAVTRTSVCPAFLEINLMAVGSPENSSCFTKALSTSHFIVDAISGSTSIGPGVAAAGTLGVTANSCVPSNAEYIGENAMIDIPSGAVSTTESGDVQPMSAPHSNSLDASSGLSFRSMTQCVNHHYARAIPS